MSKKIFTENLPHKGKNVDWKSSIGYNINFMFKDINGVMKIINYYKINKEIYLSLKYNNKLYNIKLRKLLQCKIGKILGTYSKGYKYEIDDIITNVKSGNLKILDKIRVSNGKKATTTAKGYIYQCLDCGNIDQISEGGINKQYGCNVCSNQKILIGYNDMWTTNPNLASLLANPNDGYKYMEHSKKYADWKCSSCGNIIKHKQIGNVNKSGLFCSRCSDEVSYPEKFMLNILEQLINDNFTYQLTKSNFKWCGKYKYDFYFKINNEEYIIETHGIQHYQKSFESCGGRTLQEEQENDEVKKGLALQNGIKEENYIVIDCRKSELEWIKEHILNSRLNDLFNLSSIDWLECHKYALSNRVREVCELKRDNPNMTTIEIGKIMKLSTSTINKYLRKCINLNWINEK